MVKESRFQKAESGRRLGNNGREEKDIEEPALSISMERGQEFYFKDGPVLLCEERTHIRLPQASLAGLQQQPVQAYSTM